MKWLLNIFEPGPVSTSIHYSSSHVYIDVKMSSGGIVTLGLERALARNKDLIAEIYSTPFRFWPYQASVREECKVAGEWKYFPGMDILVDELDSLYLAPDLSLLSRESLEALLSDSLQGATYKQTLRKIENNGGDHCANFSPLGLIGIWA